MTMTRPYRSGGTSSALFSPCIDLPHAAWDASSAHAEGPLRLPMAGVDDKSINQLGPQSPSRILPRPPRSVFALLLVPRRYSSSRKLENRPPAQDLVGMSGRIAVDRCRAGVNGSSPSRSMIFNARSVLDPEGAKLPLGQTLLYRVEGRSWDYCNPIVSGQFVVFLYFKEGKFILSK